MRNLRTDAGVVAESKGEKVHVGTRRLANLGHRVDVRDLGREERVGGDLDELGGGRSATTSGVPSFEDRGERRAQLGLRPGGCDTEHQAVGVQGVLHRETFAKELRVPGELELGAEGRGPGDELGEPLRGTDRHGRLADQQRLAGDAARRAR